MQATISGETHKVEVHDKGTIQDFLKMEEERFYSLVNKNALYSNKSTSNRTSLNYLNTSDNTDLNKSLRSLLLKEYSECEKMYPYLGELFLFNFFNKLPDSKKNLARFHKRDQMSFLETIKDDGIREIINWVFENSSLERTINIQVHDGDGFCVEPEDNFAFNFSYDFDFFASLSNVTFRNYKFVIVDGYIESVGEIHHLLETASKNKKPYVIFCYGMSEEVKYNIMKNNARGAIKVFPVSLDTNDENTLNILNDIAVIHDGDIVTSNMGQTISQEVRKSLKTGNKISFYRGKIYIEPVCDYKKIDSHKKFLFKRLEDAENKIDVNLDPIKNRIKNFSMKRLNLYIPQDLERNISFQNELRYCMFLFKNISKSIKILRFDKNVYYIPYDYENIVKRKAKSLKNIYKEVDIVIA